LKVPILFSQHEHRTLTGQKLYFKRVLPLFSKPFLGVVRSEYERCNAILAIKVISVPVLIRIIFQFDNAPF